MAVRRRRAAPLTLLAVSGLPVGPDPAEPADRLCVAAGLEVVVLSDDEVLVQFGSRTHPSELFRDSEVTGVLGRGMGRLLEGPATKAELVSAVGSDHEQDLDQLIVTLTEKGILTTESADPVSQYLGYAAGGSTDLSRHTVALIGCGPVGARIAAGLGQHGVGSVLLADDRPIDQYWQRFAPPGVAAGDAPAGRADAAVHDWLAEAGHRVERVEGGLESETLEDIVARADLPILALEQIDLRLAHLLNRHAVRASRPWLHALVDGNSGVVGPLFKTPETACYNEFQTLRNAATPSAAMMNRYRAHVLARGRGSFFPGLPAYAEMVAAYAILAAVHYLLKGSCFALGRALFVNFEQMVIDADDVLRLPRCPVCSTKRRPARPAFAPPAAASAPQT